MSDEEEVVINDPKAVLAALDRAKEDAKKYREQYEALVAETEPIKAELNKIKEETRMAAIKRAVSDAGADPDRVMQFLKTEGIEYKDGKLEGFEDNFKTLQNALPELFDPKKRVGGKVEMEALKDANRVRSTSELQAEKLLGNVARGY